VWPWGHFGVAYILYILYSRRRFNRPPRPEPALAVIVGSQFADLIDKPLQWIGVVPHARFIAHSLLFTAVLITGVYIAAFAFDRVETATAFVIAHLSHLVTDIPPRALIGYPFGTETLFWPFLSYPTYGFNEQVYYPPAVVEIIITPFTNSLVFFSIEMFLFGLALTLWYGHGCPGLQLIRSWFSEKRSIFRLK
jgi:hypothetical protein